MRVVKPHRILWQGKLIEGYFLLEHNGIIDALLPEKDLDWALSLADRVLEFPEGSVALPGFFDHHTHTYQRGLSLVYPNLSRARSLDEAGQIIAQNIDFPGEPLIFLDYDESNWESGPSRKWLDDIAGKRPVILRRVCGHKAVANTKALEMLPNPAGVSDPEHGILLEDVALRLFQIFPPDTQTRLNACRAGQKEALELGITGIREMGGPDTFEAWNLLRTRGELALKLEFYFLHTEMERLLQLGIKGGFGDGLSIAGIKVFADGSIGARTARFSKGYHDVNTKGLLTVDQDHLERVAKQALENGFKLAVHAIGDQAIDVVLKALERAGAKGPDVSVEHAEAITKKQLKKVAKAGYVLSVQPNFLQWQGPGGMYEAALGPERARHLNPFASMLSSGAKVVFGSDSMPPGPLFGISLAMNHPDPSQRLQPLQAIDAYSRGLELGLPIRITITDGLPGNKVLGVITP